MKKKSLKKFLALTLALVMMFGSIPLAQLTGLDFANPFVTEASAASYSTDWRYWSQGASDNAKMRKYGCWVTAQAKMLVAAGIANANSFNPDSYLNWQYNNNLINSGFYQTDGANAPVYYSNQNGGSLKYIGNLTASYSQIWNNINLGYFTILKVNNGGHYVFVDNEASLANGSIYFQESWSGSSKGYISKLSSSYSTINAVYTYRCDGSNVSNNIYEPGYYKVICSSVRVRSGPSTSYSFVKWNYRDDVVEFDAFDNGWGRIKGTNNWSCINNGYGDYYQKTSSPKPSAPTITSNVSGNVPVGTNVVVSWPAVANATGYKVLLNGNYVQTSTATSYHLNVSEAKSYTIKVQAYNSSYSSDVSNTITVTGKNPSTVTFVDWNDTVIHTQTVKYGENAIVQDAPSREGYTFTGWNKSTTNITSDTTVKATYQIKTFTVKFLDNEGEEIAGATQTVNYGDSAVAPTVELEDGFVFVGWSSDAYKNVKENATVQAITKWGNEDLPIVAEITSAYRQKDGYYVYFDLTNYPDDTTRGRAIVTLKTAEGKLVYTTESAAFSIPAGGTKTGMEVFTPCEKAASIIEVIIVKDFSTGVPISEKVFATIDDSDSWSDWSETEPADSSLETETKVQYRYRTKKYNTGNTKTLSGWIWDGTRNETVGNWSAWSWNYVASVDNESLKRNVQTQQAVQSYNYKTVYNYYRYSQNYSGGYSSPSWTSSHPNYYEYTSEVEQAVYASGKYKWYYNYPDMTYYQVVYPKNPYTTQVATSANYATQYRYRDTTYTYNFYQWGNWSEWQDTAVTANDTMDVETRTLYRYRAEGAGVEDTTGDFRTVTGTLDSSFAGKQITLFVYKIDEASDYTNEAVAQSVIGDDGSYSFTFKLREEPTVKTGDFTVAIGIEGTNNIIAIDTIEAPKATHTVTFRDWDGTVDTVTVTEGQSAPLPANPSREGHTFVGWDSNLTNIKDSIEVTARYIANTYSVIFVDWVKQTISIESYTHGEVIIVPEPQSVYGYDFSGWDGLGEEVIATQNLILTASYDAKDYTVKFYDYDGNVLSEQTVEYGDSAEIPDAIEEEGYVFLGWDYDGNLLEVDGNVTAIPIYVFEETTETPVADIESGSYTAAQTVTLSCATENAVIYYTLDGSDPADFGTEYTAPITVDKTSQLRFIASSLGKNDSAEISKYYAINDNNTESEWMAFDDIPQFVMDNLSTKYTLLSSTGYRCKDVLSTTSTSAKETYIADGWTEESTSYTEWSEWSREMPDLTDVEYEVEEKDPDPVPVKKYQYSRFEYVDKATGNIIHSHKEVPNVEGEWKTEEFKETLKISGFVPGTRTPVYDREGVEWHNQKQIMKDEVPDYKLYRYRIKETALSKWTEWTEGEPAENETRETETDTIYQYVGYRSHIITIVPLLAEGNYTSFNLVNELVDVSQFDLGVDGYTIEGFYTDAEYTNEWDIENDVVTGDLTLYVKYDINSYNVTFKNSDGTTLSTQTIEYGSSATPPEVPVADGNAFVRWDTDAYLSVTGDMIVTAVVKPEDEIVKITLNKDFFIMMEGSMIHLTATVTPDTIESTAVVWSSSDYSIADVDHNGYVTALSAGTVEIKATAIDGTFAVCKLTIEEYTDKSLKLTTDSKYGLDKDNGYLRGVSVNENTVDEIKANFRNSKVVIFKNGTELTGTDVVGTGAEVRLMNGETIVETVYVVVTGDATGDGYINNRDASYVTRYVVNKEAPSVVQLVAMDVNGDGNVNNRDASMVARYLVGKETF